MTRPVLGDVTPRVKAAGEVKPGEQGLDGGPGLLNQLDLHSNLLSLLSCDLLEPGKQLAPGGGRHKTNNIMRRPIPRFVAS